LNGRIKATCLVLALRWATNHPS